MTVDHLEQQGGVCAPQGFLAAGASCGLKASGDLDLCLIVCEERCPAAGVFTRNAFRAAPVLLTMKNLEDGYLQAVVANSGNANAWTGERGREDAALMAALAAECLGIPAEDVAVASTGVIGSHLDMEKINRGIRAAASGLKRDGSHEAAKAIMTTDKGPKEAAVSFGGFTVGGIAKGAGMIRPEMATMLAFLTTDAKTSPPELAEGLRRAVDRTFNRITVDGCTSTNDMVVAMASGRSGVSLGAEEVAEAFLPVCSRLARAIVRDGEGATRLIVVRVHGARDLEEALLAARAVSESPLVKTAFFGRDPNWGRVVQALGAAIRDLDEAGVRVLFGGLEVAGGGHPVHADEAGLKKVMSSEEVELDIHLGRGDAEEEVLTCDLGYEYVRINAEYHT
ncbi:MAG: bifunctional glutamate N-acetyltransferase/amino-acid acetyltransferase ArgJ [Actinobacteria bacterium]|nr:bifunctional glutamate N-acetyltransferase/amino-acid acetyltransferase ArgJ [Actinomycetota bacterium]